MQRTPYSTPANAAIPSSGDAEQGTLLDLMGNAPADLTRRLDLAVHRRKRHVACRATVLDHLAFNRVSGLHHSHGLEERDIDDCLAFFAEANVKRFFVQLPVAPEYEEVRSWLRSRELVPYERRWVTYERGAEPIEVPPHDFSVRDATEEHSERVGRILAAAFDCKPEGAALFSSTVGKPRWTVKVALNDEGAVMGVGLMFVHEKSACLPFAATDPNFRGQGVQRVLMATRIALALEYGCTHLSTETGEEVPDEPNPSGNNMVRCGFRPVVTNDNWAPPGTTWMPQTSTSPYPISS